jgi:hypothetical protein
MKEHSELPFFGMIGNLPKHFGDFLRRMGRNVGTFQPIYAVSFGELAGQCRPKERSIWYNYAVSSEKTLFFYPFHVPDQASVQKDKLAYSFILCLAACCLSD